ncbi:MAG: hypothetical protein AAF682_13890 [Planctomycetota bacterium]
MRRLLAPGLLLALASATGAQLLTDTQIADLSSAPDVKNGFSGGFASDGALAYFGGSDPASGLGARLWATDGTTAGTVQLTSQAMIEREARFLPGGDLFLAVDELGVGVGLWRTDGTAAGTVEVQPPLAWTTVPHDLTVFGGAVWFLAGQAATGVELWRSDLATGATALAFELAPGSASGASQLFAGAGGLLVADGAQDALLWTDGTPGGGVQVASLPLSGSGSFEHVVEVGPRVVFNVDGPGAERGWWASDGTPAGTFQLLQTVNDHWAVGAATKAYLAAGSVSTSTRLFETDGTLAGTKPISFGGATDGQIVSVRPGLAVGDELFYSGLVHGVGFEPCRTSGAAGGAALVQDLHPTDDSDPGDFVSFGGEVFFLADDGATGREIWRLDPAAGGAQLVADLTPGLADGVQDSPPALLAAAHGVVFGFSFRSLGVEPAVTDGAQTALLLNLSDDGLSGGSAPKEFARLGSRAVFHAFDETAGRELWITDGTGAGTSLLANLTPDIAGQPQLSGSSPRFTVQLGERAFFFADTPATGQELWATDGTASGTALVADLVPGPGSGAPQFGPRPVALGDALYFIAREPGGAFALWRTDGATLATTPIVTVDPTGFLAEFSDLKRVGDRLLFEADGPAGVELWSSDGTPAGTSLLVDMTPGPIGTSISALVPGETQALVFTPSAPTALWRTDGTPAGTTPVLTGLPGPIDSASFAASGDTFYFSLTDAATGKEPWISDGTPAGTQRLIDLVPGQPGSGAASFTPAGDRVFFTAWSSADSKLPGQLWMTDGTAAGTTLAADLPLIPTSAGLADFWAPTSDRRLLFTHADANGEEWWLTDGTPAGTRALTDSAPGPKWARPRPGALLGGQLLFVADDGTHGEELHALPVAATGGYAVVELGAGCAGAGGVPRLLVESGAPAAGQALLLGLRDAAPASSALWFFDQAYGALPPIGTCTVQLPTPTLFASTPTDGAGAATFALQLANDPALAGLQADLQALSVEPGGPFQGLGALSGVLELIVGP